MDYKKNQLYCKKKLNFTIKLTLHTNNTHVCMY